MWQSTRTRKLYQHTPPTVIPQLILAYQPVVALMHTLDIRDDLQIGAPTNSETS